MTRFRITDPALVPEEFSQIVRKISKGVRPGIDPVKRVVAGDGDNDSGTCVERTGGEQD